MVRIMVSNSQYHGHHGVSIVSIIIVSILMRVK